ncbi:MAG: hypothetical protein LBI91_00725 [Spirochaetaceae bacterium]|jgi:hypothetical protein|nr:hypothetical protein [Spirochaetaceae bacterium]
MMYKFRKSRLLLAFFCLMSALLAAEPLYSPTWGFRVDLPPDMELADGDGRNRFSFRSGENLVFELAAYDASRYESIGQMALDIQKRLGNSGDVSGFNYYGLDAALMELSFSGNEGWALCVELEKDAGAASSGAGERGGGPKPKLLALAFGPAGKTELQPLYLSILDSVAPAPLLTLAPGPVTEFAYPRENRKQVRPANSSSQAWVFDTDAEAAQFLVDREFGILRRYESGTLWKEAWVRFYRAIYRDSFDRLRDIALALGQEWARGGDSPAGGGNGAAAGGIPGQALKWVQSFSYERNLMGSDFVNLVSAALEGRGDCDSRSLLWAVILSQADIPAAIMVSREYSHAMGLAGVDGPGARFEFADKEWLVAETTAQVSLGLINSKTSDSGKWIGINFY